MTTQAILLAAGKGTRMKSDLPKVLFDACGRPMIGYVIDTNTDTTDLVILDAQQFSSPPVAAITVPLRIPPGFHGNWVALP